MKRYQWGKKIMIEYNNTDAEFQETLRNHEYVLCNFTASWCGPCRAIAPIAEQLAKDYSHIKFIKVDVDENSETSSDYSIRAMPTFMLFHDGVKVKEFMGANPSHLKQMAESAH
jgi:thioredoxin 1